MNNQVVKILLSILAWLILTTTAICAQETSQQSEPKGQVTPTLRYLTVDGDEEKFREDWWIREHWAGGIGAFTLQYMYDNDAALSLEGRAILPEEDYELLFQVTKPDVGFLHAGYTEYRKYFDGTGGFFERFPTPSFELANDMHLDIGNLFIDVGLSIPNWPKLVFGYEHQFKDGRKSLLEWGSVTEGGITRNIFPAFKEIDEEADIFKAEVEHETGTVQVGDKVRYEHYRTATKRFGEERDLDAGTSETVSVSENYSHHVFSNTLHLESHVNEKVYWSVGYLFTNLDGGTAFRMSTTPFGPEPFDKNWFTRSADIDQDSHVANVNALFGPFKDLTLYGGLQAETTETKGDTDGVLTETSFPGGGEVTPEAVIVSRTDKGSLEETVGARYTGIKYTTLYAEGKWTQQNIDLFERELEDNVLNFERSTDTEVERERYTVGFNTSPIPRTTLSARYRRRYHDNDYNHLLDTEPGYSAFITAQDFTSDEITTKLTVRPSSRVKVSLKYQLVATDIDTQSDTTPPSAVQSGDYDADIYSVSITVTPISRLYLTGLFSYQDARSTAFDNGVPSVITYDGDVYTVIGTAGYAIDEKTDLTGEYLYTRSDNFTDNSADGLPLGLDNQRQGLLVGISRRITKNADASLHYGFYKYEEDSNGGADNYTVHLVSTSWVFRF
jgi:hypothetical protein